MVSIFHLWPFCAFFKIEVKRYSIFFLLPVIQERFLAVFYLEKLFLPVAEHEEGWRRRRFRLLDKLPFLQHGGRWCRRRGLGAGGRRDHKARSGGRRRGAAQKTRQKIVSLSDAFISLQTLGESETKRERDSLVSYI
jgi:hypothetical protein